MSNQEQPIIEVKGFREGLRIILHPELPLVEVREALANHLDRFGDAFAGTGVLLDVGARTVSDDDLRVLQKLLYRRYGLEIRRVLTDSDRTRESAEILKLAAVPTVQNREAEVVAESPQEASREFARVIRQTVRAGQVERFYEGSIVVLGDVNPGGEILASGDIVVLGSLRGIAWAGCLGDNSALIIAHQLVPTQLRIASALARSPAEAKPRRRKDVELARVVEDKIIVEEYHGI